MANELSKLSPNPGSRRPRTRVGRGEGSGKGTTAGRGTKGDKSRLTSEAADVLFHLLVMLKSRDVALEDIYQELQSRSGTSGLVEKANR